MTTYDENAWREDCVDLAYHMREFLASLWHNDLINTEEARDNLYTLLMEAEIILDK